MNARDGGAVVSVALHSVAIMARLLRSLTSAEYYNRGPQVWPDSGVRDSSMQDVIHKTVELSRERYGEVEGQCD
jgi:hypothetical protein